MASVTAKQKVSAERKKLELVMGNHQVNLAKLKPEELNGLLKEWLHNVVLRELRGFTPLRDTLSRRGDEPVTVSPEAKITHRGFSDTPLNLDTQTLWAYRGVLSAEHTFSRPESDEQTTDREVVSSWGRQAYLLRGEEGTLLLRRQTNHTRADENLYLATYFYEKVPHKKQWVVGKIITERIDPQSFSARFEDEAPRIAQWLLWSIRDTYSRTHTVLASQASFMKQCLEKWEKIAGTIHGGR